MCEYAPHLAGQGISFKMAYPSVLTRNQLSRHDLQNLFCSRQEADGQGFDIAAAGKSEQQQAHWYCSLWLGRGNAAGGGGHAQGVFEAISRVGRVPRCATGIPSQVCLNVNLRPCAVHPLYFGTDNHNLNL